MLLCAFLWRKKKFKLGNCKQFLLKLRHLISSHMPNNNAQSNFGIVRPTVPESVSSNNTQQCKTCGARKLANETLLWKWFKKKTKDTGPGLISPRTLERTCTLRADMCDGFSDQLATLDDAHVSGKCLDWSSTPDGVEWRGKKRTALERLPPWGRCRL